MYQYQPRLGSAICIERTHILHSLAMSPPSWINVPTPSKMRICVNPISLMYSSFVYSGILPHPAKSVAAPRPPQTTAKNHSLIKSLRNPKNSNNYIHRTISLVPKFTELLHRPLDVALRARADDGLDDDGVRLVADFEDVVARDEAEARVCGLEVVDGLSHVAFGGEDECCEAVVVVFYLVQGGSDKYT